MGMTGTTMPAVTRATAMPTTPATAADGARGRPVADDRLDFPILRATPGGRAERFAARLDGRHPALVFFAAIVLGFIVVAAISIGVAELVNKLLLPAGGIGTADESVNEWLARNRTSALTDVSSVGSFVGGAPLLPILVGVMALAFAALRHWRLAAYMAFGLAVESALYRVTSLAVPRHRPAVDRLDNLPVNASYPSGHTAASVVVYSGIALLLTSRMTRRGSRALTWSIAALITLFVAGSRMYRGMHHPIDVIAGALLGFAALIVLVGACRAAGAAADRRAAQDEGTRA